MTIGIPRAGFYYKYFPFWKNYFEALGFDISVSPKSDKIMIEKGLKAAQSESCYPIKMYYGHLLALKDKADILLIPQMNEHKMGKGRRGTATFFCPYFVSLADMIMSEFPKFKVFRPIMDFHDNKIVSEPWINFGRSVLKKSLTEVDHAVDKAMKMQFNFEKRMQENDFFSSEEAFDESSTASRIIKPKIALIGRPYMIFDEYTSHNLKKRIESFGYSVVSQENISFGIQQAILSKINENEKQHWYLTNQELSAFYYYLLDKDVKGMIYIIPFNCGPDFVLEEFTINKLKKKKPITKISLDENTSSGAISTRLEAFFDLVKK